MFQTKTNLLLLPVIFASVFSAVPAEEVTHQPDPLCQQLFDTYIARQGKINTSTIMAASHIIAERGQDTGFWKNVLQELQKGRSESEIGCVRVLGKMLAIDAYARDVIRREKESGQLQQWIPSICLGPEVVKELIARGKAADRLRVDDYAIALLRARVPEAVDFFRMILRDSTGGDYLADTKFHAAVGLVQLGEADGYIWLIENSEDSLSTVSNAWPAWISDRKLATCSVAALRVLSGEKDLKSKQEWQSWWSRVDKSKLPKNPVPMDDL